MSEGRSARELFRPEAVAHHARAARAGSVLPLSRRGLAVPFWLLVLALIAGIAGLVTVRAEERSRGAARIGSSPQFSVYFPVAVAPDLRPGSEVVLTRGDGRRLRARLVAVGPAITASAVGQRLGNGAVPPGLGAAVTAMATLQPATVVPEGVYRAEVVLRREPIAKLLVPGFRSLIGRRG